MKRWYSGDSPCMDCEDRHPTCHGSCEKYLEYQKSRLEIYKQRKEMTTSQNLVLGYASKNRERIRKRAPAKFRK